MKRKESSYDYLVKLLIIGNSGVGKTNLLLRFCEDTFLTSHLSTIGIDFKTKTVLLNGVKVKLQIWDTAGQERFKTITQTYYRGAMGIILTYSVEDKSSFEDIQNWIKQIKMHAQNDVLKVLVGNKLDSEKRVISFEEGLRLAQELDMQFFETSAKDNINVSQMFMKIGQLANSILSNTKTQKQEKNTKVSEIGTTRNLLINNESTKQKKKTCC